VQTVSKSSVPVVSIPARRAALARPVTAQPRAQMVPDSIPNVRHQHDHVDPRIWQRSDMRAFLAHRDIAAVYRLLQRHGVSQRAIAARTGQSQSEISEIIAGRRRVVSYEVLLRIAEGLDLPRGWMGMAYTYEEPRQLSAWESC